MQARCCLSRRGRGSRYWQWLYWQVARLGPMAGQNHHFARYAPERIPYPIELAAHPLYAQSQTSCGTALSAALCQTRRCSVHTDTLSSLQPRSVRSKSFLSITLHLMMTTCWTGYWKNRPDALSPPAQRLRRRRSVQRLTFW
jgi:hypothetical protein